MVEVGGFDYPEGLTFRTSNVRGSFLFSCPGGALFFRPNSSCSWICLRFLDYLNLMSTWFCCDLTRQAEIGRVPLRMAWSLTVGISEVM